MSYHESSSKRSSKRNKIGDIKRDILTITIITEVEVREEDITRLIRSCISNPSRL